MPLTDTSPAAELSGSSLRPRGMTLIGETVCCQRFSRSMKLMESSPI